MIIRSQNKKGIVNMNNIDTIDVFDMQVRYFSGGGIDTMGILGTYSAEEKALKVLDMIQSAYTDGNEWLCVAGKVFQMPQDSEV